MKSLLLFLSLIVLNTALYEHQAGVFDWSIKNIGEIDSVNFVENNFYFTVKDDENSVGSANIQNGDFFLKNRLKNFFHVYRKY